MSDTYNRIPWDLWDVGDSSSESNDEKGDK